VVLFSCISLVRRAAPRLRRELRLQAIERPTRPAHNANVPSKKQIPKVVQLGPELEELEEPDDPEDPAEKPSTDRLLALRPCILGSVTFAERPLIPRMDAFSCGTELLTKMPSIPRMETFRWGGTEPLAENPSTSRVVMCFSRMEPDLAFASRAASSSGSA